MALRSMRQHFETQNWVEFAVDLVIVVVGVFLGLQAANWNEERRDRALEESYLLRLQSDLDKTIAANSEQLDWIDGRENAQVIVLSALRTGELKKVDEAAFEQGLLYLGFIGRPRLYWGTVEELKSSGNMNLISDDDLRTAVVDLEGRFEREMGDAETEFARIAELRRPIDTRYSVNAHILSNSRDDIDQTDIDYDFESMVGDEDLINRISHVQFNSQLTANGFRQILIETQRVKAMVDERLDRSK